MEEGNAVQQRIKKMRELKKTNPQRQSSEFGKRLKSNLVKEEDSSTKEMIKPQSSHRLRRPVSAMKPIQSQKTITTTSTSPAEIDLKPYVRHAFEYGHLMKQFAKSAKIDVNQWHYKMLANKLFTIRVLSRLHREPEEGYPDIVEEMLIQKIKKMVAVQAQEKKCEQAEDRMQKLLEERLRSLAGMKNK